MINHAHNKVLVVDDETSMRELLEIVLGNEGYEVRTVPNISEAKQVLSKDVYDVVVTDLRMGQNRNAGMQLLAWLHENAPQIPAIMITAHGSVETAIEAMKLGAADYILKPFKNDEIRLLVRRAIEQRNLVRENVALRKDQAERGRLDNIIGKSAAIEVVRDMIRRVAALPTTVALHGESGTGKELVARAIHQASPRSAKPFVAINCGGIPENLLESELFGHKKGAFTGAVEDKEGLFVVASGGTLFLDEIGEMPLSLQVRLLRVLDSSSVLPVGGVSETKVDVRIISATNRNLDNMVKEGTFRKDLFYRLNVIPLNLPALRERIDDIPLLALHFVEVHSGRLGRRNIVLSEHAEEILRAFDWPGNVRELENVMERAVALCSGSRIEVADLPQELQHMAMELPEVPLELPAGGIDMEKLVADVEINLIRQALQKSHYCQKKAAILLGLSARSLRYRLQKYGIEEG